MSFSIICQSCGERVEIPPDHARSKIRCPLCGVYCPIPKDRPTAPSSAKAEASHKSSSDVDEDALADWLADDDLPDPPPERSGGITTEPRPSRQSAPPPRKAPREEYDHLEEVDDEQEVTYGLVEDPQKLCEGCKGRIEKELKVCPKCGFDFDLGRVPEKKVKPIFRRWEPWLSKERRLQAFFFSSIAGVALGLTGAISMGYWLAFLGPALGLIGLLAFLLGSFLRIELNRTSKGKIRLTRTWIICFVQRPAERLRPGDYEGVHTSRVEDTGCLEWAIFLFFFPSIILAGLWWWFVMRREWYQVALTQGHGYPACILYFGGSEALMDEMATSLCTEADFRRI